MGGGLLFYPHYHKSSNSPGLSCPPTYSILEAPLSISVPRCWFRVCRKSSDMPFWEYQRTFFFFSRIEEMIRGFPYMVVPQARWMVFMKTLSTKMDENWGNLPTDLLETSISQKCPAVSNSSTSMTHGVPKKTRGLV